MFSSVEWIWSQWSSVSFMWSKDERVHLIPAVRECWAASLQPSRGCRRSDNIFIHSSVRLSNINVEHVVHRWVKPSPDRQTCSASLISIRTRLEVKLTLAVFRLKLHGSSKEHVNHVCWFWASCYWSWQRCEPLFKERMFFFIMYHNYWTNLISTVNCSVMTSSGEN